MRELRITFRQSFSIKFVSPSGWINGISRSYVCVLCFAIRNECPSYDVYEWMYVLCTFWKILNLSLCFAIHSGVWLCAVIITCATLVTRPRSHSLSSSHTFDGRPWQIHSQDDMVAKHQKPLMRQKDSAQWCFGKQKRASEASHLQAFIWNIRLPNTNQSPLTILIECFRWGFSRLASGGTANISRSLEHRGLVFQWVDIYATLELRNGNTLSRGLFWIR